MGLYDYTDGSHPGGFTGYRVSRKVGDANHQIYFSAKQRDLAVAKDEELRQQQEKLRQHSSQAQRRQASPYNYTKADRFKPPRRTGVRGLTIVFQTGNRECVVRPYYPAIQVSATRSDGTRVHTSRSITERTGRTLTSAWYDCARLLAEARDLSRVPSHWLKAEPSPDQFEKLRRYYNKRDALGIPKSVLDHLFATSEF